MILNAISARSLLESVRDDKKKSLENVIKERIESGVYDPIFKIIELSCKEGRSNIRLTSVFLSDVKINWTYIKSDFTYLGYTVITKKSDYDIILITIEW